MGMPELKRSTKIMLMASITIVVLLYGLILMLQRSDSATINTAKELDAFVVRYCENTGRVPSMKGLAVRYPHLHSGTGWRFFTDARTYLRMQYPVKWWNKDAIGVRQLSAFTATPTSYVVEYRCGQSR